MGFQVSSSRATCDYSPQLGVALANFRIGLEPRIRLLALLRCVLSIFRVRASLGLDPAFEYGKDRRGKGRHRLSKATTVPRAGGSSLQGI